MKKSPKKYYGFTLVELIIVITILAILSTVAFVSFQGYTKSSRDSVRLENLLNIEKGLEVYSVKSGNYPTPDNSVTISLSGSNISYQGTLGDNSSKIVGFAKAPTDPLDNSNYYYSTNVSGKSYSLVSFSENQTSFIPNQALADNSNKSSLTKGNLSYILDANNNQLTSNTDLFGNGSGTVYNQIINNTKKLTLSGINLGGGYQMLAIKNGDYSAPKSCPDGFIPVVGSADFSQPGFCVMKYEASYEDAITPNSTTTGIAFNTVDYDSTKKPVSKAGVYPIGNITQISAIQSCSQIGGHLITNNEWITIARQIENNSVNWSNGQVGSGYISNGISNSNLGCLGASNIIYTGATRARGTKAGAGFGTSTGALSCDQKRQLTLSNGEIIWDLAGNVREHVNKNNTKSGLAYNDGFFNFDSNASNWVGTYSRYNAGWNGAPEIMKQTYGPANSNYTYSANGVGTVYGIGTNTLNNIFRKGGSSQVGSYIGIYALATNWPDNYDQTTGFRCAY